MAASASRRVLGDYFTLQRGTTYKSRLLGVPGPVLLGLATIQRNGGFRRDSLQTYGGDSPEKLLVRPGELYLSLKDVTQSADLLGAVARLPRDHPPGRLTQDTVKLEPKASDVPLDYLYWLLRTPQYRGYCRSHATGTTNLGLARDDFLAFPAPEPSPMQLGIVNTLTALDDKIELNRRMSETLEAMARALFKSWFVYFDPVRAKVEGRDPDLPKPLADLFPARLVDSELGEIPEGWKAAQLMDAIEFVDGRTLPSSVRDDDGAFRAFGANGPIAHTTQAWVDSPCIVLGKIGSCGALHRSAAPTWVTNNAFAVRAGRSRSLEFAWHSLKSVDFSNYVGGSANPYMPLKNFGHHQIVLPPTQLLERFQAVAGVLRSRVEYGDVQSSYLAALRDALLPKLISGELRIGDAEEFIGRGA